MNYMFTVLWVTGVTIAVLIAWEVIERLFFNKRKQEAARKRLLARAEETGRRLLMMEPWKVELGLTGSNTFTPEEIAEKASRAFEVEFTINIDSITPLDVAFLGVERPEVAAADLHTFVGFESRLFEIWQIPIDGGLLLAVNYMPSALHAKELENGYRWTGKLASQFIHDAPVTISLKQSKHGPLDAEKARQALCSENLESALAWLGMPD